MNHTFLTPLKRSSWSPYVAGVGIGILSWFAFASAHHPLGITTAFENTAALVEKAVAPKAAEQSGFFEARIRENEPPTIDWEWMLVVGVLAGAYGSSRFSGDRTREKVPQLWAWRFGPGIGKRYLWAFLGGAVMMFGARMAGGCTSGHGISGTLQLAVSSWIFVVVLFGTGITSAHLIFGKAGKDHV